VFSKKHACKKINSVFSSCSVKVLKWLDLFGDAFVISTKSKKVYNANQMKFVAEMEVVPYGKNFRLVPEDELPELLEYLSQYLPQSLKVSIQ
jgi:hypothetical protein